jgi:hypothetical protein
MKVKIYYNKTELATAFSKSWATIASLVKEIEGEVEKGRYNQYAICDDRVNIGVFADYYKYRKRLRDKNLRRTVPPFEIGKALLMIPNTQPQEENIGA